MLKRSFANKYLATTVAVELFLLPIFFLIYMTDFFYFHVKFSNFSDFHIYQLMLQLIEIFLNKLLPGLYIHFP